MDVKNSDIDSRYKVPCQPGILSLGDISAAAMEAEPSDRGRYGCRQLGDESNSPHIGMTERGRCDIDASDLTRRCRSKAMTVNDLVLPDTDVPNNRHSHDLTVPTQLSLEAEEHVLTIWQVSKWTGQWVCRRQQAGFSLLPTP